MKKFIFLSLSLIMALSSNAQWKVTSVDDCSNKDNELFQIVETEQSVFIFGVFNHRVEQETFYNIPRKTKVDVKGEIYKIKSTMNIPMYDDAEKKWAVLQPDNHKVTYILEFEKFPVVDGFSIISDKVDGFSYDLNNKGIHIEKIDSSELIKTERFLDGGCPLIKGNFSKDDKDFVYYISENVSITFHVERNGKDLLYFVDIVNKSDHGVTFNTENVCVTATKSKGDEKKEEFNLERYSPSSYEQYFQQQDYKEAKNAVGVMYDVADQIERTSWKTTEYGSWGRFGMDLLASAAEQIGENDIQEYMKSHPKTHPQPLKSNGVNPGETYQGFVAFKYKKSDSQLFHFKMEGYDYTMNTTFMK